VAQEVAAHVMGVSSFAGFPPGFARGTIGQLPSGFWVATRNSIPRLMAGRMI
jgi:hypothetical protein